MSSADAWYSGSVPGRHRLHKELDFRGIERAPVALLDDEVNRTHWLKYIGTRRVPAAHETLQLSSE